MRLTELNNRTGMTYQRIPIIIHRTKYRLITRMRPDIHRERRTPVVRIRRLLLCDVPISDIIAINGSNSNVREEHMENRIPRKGHLPGYYVLRNIGTGSRRESADVFPEWRTDCYSCAVQMHEFKAGGGGWAGIVVVVYVDSEVREFGGAGVGVAVDYLLVDPFDGGPGAGGKVFVEDVGLGGGGHP